MKRKIISFLLTILLGAAVAWVVASLWLYPQHQSEDESSIPYQRIFEEFVQNELIPTDGIADLNEYRYNRYGDSGELQYARDRSGLVSVQIDDFDGDYVPELLAVMLVPKEENYDYSQVEVQLYRYDEATGQVVHAKRLTEEIPYLENGEEKKFRPLTVTGIEDDVRVFFAGDYLYLESIARGQESTATLTAFPKQDLAGAPAFVLRLEQKPGMPLCYYECRANEEATPLFAESEQKEVYMEEFIHGNESPVSEEGLAWLTSSIDVVKEKLESLGLSPVWTEYSSFVWVDGRLGCFTFADQETNALMSYSNHLEETEDAPNQPAVQTVSDGTNFHNSH